MTQVADALAPRTDGEGEPKLGRLGADYKRLALIREPVLAQAREQTSYVLGHLLPPPGHVQGQDLPTPFSNTAARGAVSLSNKLHLTIFPANTTFVRFEGDPVEWEAMRSINPGIIEQITEKWRSTENSIVREVERNGWRPQLAHAIQLLVVTGNSCEWFKPENELSIFALDQYVAQWDGSGNLIKCIILEKIAWGALPEEIQAQIREANPQLKPLASTEYELYTGVRLEQGKMIFEQEVAGILNDGVTKSFDPDFSPIRASRFTISRQNEYGISRVAMFFGDIKSLDGTSQCLLEASAVCARVLWGVLPNSFASSTDLNQVPNGGYVVMNKDDVFSVTADKHADLQVVRATREDLVASVSFAFAMNAAIQRDAERVTAEEVRFMAQELDDTLGGAHASLAKELQVPVANMALKALYDRGLEKLPPGVKVRIVTGVEALGRNHELMRIQTALATAKSAGLPPEAVLDEIHTNELVRRIFESAGVDMKNLVKSSAESAQGKAQKQQAMMLQQALPNLVNKGADMAMAAAQPQQAAPAQ